MTLELDIRRLVQRSDCDCADFCFAKLDPGDGKKDVTGDISMGYVVELNLEDLARKKSNLVAFNGTCNRISVLRSCQYGVDNMARFEWLVWLDLSHNMLSEVPEHFSKLCPSLVHLDLSSNRFSDVLSVEHLGGLVKLKHLDLSYNQVYNLKGIQHITSVTHLDIHKNRIESLTPLVGCLRLSRLNIAHNNLNSVAECIASIGKLPTLRRLDIYGNPFCVEHGNSDFRSAFALKTRVIFLDNVNIRTINSDLPASFLTGRPSPGNLAELRQLFEDRMYKLHSDHKLDLQRLHKLIEELTTKFDDRCKRLALDYEAAKRNITHTDEKD